MKLNIHTVDDQQRPALFDVAVGDARSAKHLDATSLEVIQILGVVNPALPIDFVIMNPDRDFVLVNHFNWLES